jgi:hypothetical protein
MPTYQLPSATISPATAPPRPSLMSVGVTPMTVGVPDTGPVHISALPLEVDLALYKGDDFYLDLILTDPDGSDTDLSAATPSAQIRVAPNDDLLAVFDTTVDGNTIHLHLPHDQSINLQPGQCAWDAQITTSTDITTTLVAGAVSVAGEVTMPL